MHQFGKELGVSHVCIMFWERGTHHPRYDSMLALRRFEMAVAKRKQKERQMGLTPLVAG